MADGEKIAVVTGAGIGIGAATARALGAEGHTVFVTDILEAEGKAVADDIVAAGGRAEFHRLDVTDTAACDALAGLIAGRHGAATALVANAGVAPRIPYEALDDARWDKLFDINLKGQFRLIRALAPAMCARGEGAIVCVSSIAGPVVGWDDHWHYAAAKAGITGLVRSAALELAKSGVRINGIAPGFVRTAQILSEENSLGEAGLIAAEPSVPLKRAADPSEIADVAAFLLSGKASYITGQTIIVDGGLTAAM